MLTAVTASSSSVCTHPPGLEEQPLTYTLEFIVVSMFRKQGDKTQESVSQ